MFCQLAEQYAKSLGLGFLALGLTCSAVQGSWFIEIMVQGDVCCCSVGVPEVNFGGFKSGLAILLGADM